MRIGRVTPDKEALVTLRMYGRAGQRHEIDFVLDTGYTEYLTLPPASIAALGLPYVYSMPMYLADGTRIHVRVFDGVVLWRGRKRSVPVQETAGDALLGMSLLYGSRLLLDVIDGGDAVVRSLP